MGFDVHKTALQYIKEFNPIHTLNGHSSTTVSDDDVNNIFDEKLIDVCDEINGNAFKVVIDDSNAKYGCESQYLLMTGEGSIHKYNNGN